MRRQFTCCLSILLVVQKKIISFYATSITLLETQRHINDNEKQIFYTFKCCHCIALMSSIYAICVVENTENIFFLSRIDVYCIACL